MGRIESRLDAGNEIVRQFLTFAKKAMDEINRLHENSESSGNGLVLDEDGNEAVSEEQFMYNSKNLYDIGGSTPRERAINLANVLWNSDERRKFCIEPRKELIGGRVPVDEERTEIFRNFTKIYLGKDASELRYRSILNMSIKKGLTCRKSELVRLRRKMFLQPKEVPINFDQKIQLVLCQGHLEIPASLSFRCCFL